jgi:hypothetical protein
MQYVVLRKLSISLTMVFQMLTGTRVIADTEIHRCLLEDGTVAFQEMPCAEPATETDDESETSDSRSAKAPAVDDDSSDFASPFDDVAPAEPSKPNPPAPASQNRARCEKTTRDAIDAIDLEMQENAYSEEQGQEYLAELLTLTKQLRACKQL